MKELTIEQKAQRYDEAISMAKKFCTPDSNNTNLKATLEMIFPELKESKDERIRKQLIVLVKSSLAHTDEEINEMIAWLEKQGEHANFRNKIQIGDKVTRNEDGVLVNLSQLNRVAKKQGEQKPAIEMKTPEESLGINSKTYNKIVDECVYGEQNPIKEHNACEFCEDRYGCVNPCSMKLIEKEKHADEIKPKFKVRKGEWYVCTNTFVSKGKIIAIKGQIYQSKQEDDTITCEYDCLFIDRHDGKASDYFRSWTIQDAKDGDVLIDKSSSRECPFIFKETKPSDIKTDILNPLTVLGYCGIGGAGFTKGSGWGDTANCIYYPATKEQRNQLEKAMADAGYTFDFEKKELKKIESYSLRSIIKDEPSPAIKKVVDSLSVWSEEDERNLNDAIHAVEDMLGNNGKNTVTWLKSLKDRYIWRPSDEQMKALLKLEDMHVLEHEKKQENAHLYMVVKSIREQLLKLREE